MRPTTLVMFGGTGDLAHRKLLAGLYNLAHDGALPERFRLVGVARADHPHEDFRQMARESIVRFSRREPDPDVLDGLIADIRYIPGTFDDDAVYAELTRTLDEFDDRRRASSIASSTFRRRHNFARSPASSRQRDCTASEHAHTRIVIEKPFGHDLVSARALNREVLTVLGESQVYRIDHYLGKETVQNMSHCGSPTRCSSRSGTATLSTASRSPRPRTAASAAAPRSGRHRERRSLD